MKRAVNWILFTTILVMVITWGVVGLNIFNGDYESVTPGCYIVLVCLIVNLACILSFDCNRFFCNCYCCFVCKEMNRNIAVSKNSFYVAVILTILCYIFDFIFVITVRIYCYRCVCTLGNEIPLIFFHRYFQSICQAEVYEVVCTVIFTGISVCNYICNCICSIVFLVAVIG